MQGHLNNDSNKRCTQMLKETGGLKKQFSETIMPFHFDGQNSNGATHNCYSKFSTVVIWSSSCLPFVRYILLVQGRFLHQADLVVHQNRGIHRFPSLPALQRVHEVHQGQDLPIQQRRIETISTVIMINQVEGEKIQYYATVLCTYSLYMHTNALQQYMYIQAPLMVGNN